MKDFNFRKEVLKHYESVLSYMTHSIGDSDIAKDVLQETYVRVFQKEATYTHNYHIRNWITMIARNIYRDQYRAKARYSHIRLDVVDIQLVNETVYDASEDLRRTFVALSRLAPTHQEVFELMLEGNTYEQISEKTDFSVGSIKSLLCRDRIKLRKLLNRKKS